MTNRQAATAQWPSWLKLLLAFAGYIALTLVLTFPLILNLSSRLPKDLGDPLLATTILWWNAHVTPLTERWWNGFGFFPAPGMMSFSEHFLGASLIASPVQWLGGSPVTAYNVTFLLSFPLCAIAAHALALTLTRRHDAALICGLAYGFNPYRVAHVEHLELLLAFGMPAALMALHRYASTRGTRWLVALGGALITQALCSSYYIVFFTLFIGLWMLWFMRPHEWRQTIALAASCITAAVIVSPVIVGYIREHQRYNWRRNLPDEIARFSADLSSFVTASPLSALWGWTAPLNGSERQLFPGLTITILAAAGIVLVSRTRRPDGRIGTASAVFSIIAAVLAAVAAGTYFLGPWRIEWMALRADRFDKPLSLALGFTTLAAGSSFALRSAFRERSMLAFYLIAGALCFLCSMGPVPTSLGTPFLYEPPYRWLTALPFFGDTVRVPARFGMLGMLAIAIAGSLAFDRLRALPRQRTALLLVTACGITADGWIRGLTFPAPPPRGFAVPNSDGSTALMELPLGDLWRDTAAMYRATFHHMRVVNGYNGFGPLYYGALQHALDNRDPTALDALSSFGPLTIALDTSADADRSLTSFISNYPGIRQLARNGGWMLYELAKRGNIPAEACSGPPLRIAAAFARRGPIDVSKLNDRNPRTQWIAVRPQIAGDAMTIDLGRAHAACGLALSLGSAAELYPRMLSVAISIDGVAWQTEFVGKMGGATIRAALDDPRQTRIAVPLRGKPARFLRLRIEQSDLKYPWAVADIIVLRPS